MMRIQLCTREGELVTEVDIPLFRALPEGVAWGSRIFFIDKKSYFRHSLPVYREGFLYTVIPEMGFGLERK